MTEQALGELPTAEELGTLQQLVTMWQGYQTILAAAQEQAKKVAADIADIETNLIPSLMASAAGMEKFTLANGTAVTLKDELFASVTQANQQAAFAWLEGHGHADVIKDELKIALGKGTSATERALSLIATAESWGISDYSRKRAVHPGTLQALLKEQLAEGVDVPKETFGVFQQRRAIIKLAKEAE